MTRTEQAALHSAHDHLSNAIHSLYAVKNEIPDVLPVLSANVWLQHVDDHIRVLFNELASAAADLQAEIENERILAS